jgi:hypothetical protein
MKKKQHKTASQLDFNSRQLRLLDELPNYAWDIVKAGIAAGYSQAYAISTLKRQVQKNAKLCTAILAKREKITATSLDDVELVKKTMRQIINDPQSRRADVTKACDVLCKIAGVYSERRVIEDVTRQRELDAAEQAEAQFLATIRLRLPAAGAMVTLPNIIEAVTSRADNRLCASHTQPDIRTNSIETRGNQGDSNGIATPVQALLTDGQDAAREGLRPQASAGASFPSSA